MKPLAFLLGWNTLLWGIVGGLVAPLVPGGWLTIVTVAIALLLPVVPLARGFANHGYPSAAVRIWLFRPFWYGQLFLLFLAAAGLVGLLAGLLFGAPAAGGRWALAGMAMVLIAAAAAGYAGTRRLRVKTLEVAFADLPGALEGMRIVQLSDLHVGPHTRGDQLARIRSAVERAAPDLIVLTGDQVDDYVRDVEPLGEALGGISAPLGVFAVAGNHDVYAGWAEVRAGMEPLGWRVLVNEAIPLAHRGATFWLAGTGDPAGRGGPMGPDPSVAPDVERTLASVPTGAFTLALAHDPRLWPELAARGVHLTLSGHTHWGQFALPALNWCLASPFLDLAMGMYQRGDSILYINPGTNYWGVPLRIGALPEVTVAVLRRRPPDATGGGREGAMRSG